MTPPLHRILHLFRAWNLLVPRFRLRKPAEMLVALFRMEAIFR